MNTPLNLKTLKQHFAYSWWKYLLVALIAFGLVDLLYTVTAYRSPANKKVEFYVYGMMEQEKLTSYMEKVRTTEMEDMEVMTPLQLMNDSYYGPMQLMTYINEGNLYRCIFQSRKAEAEKFQTWVFEEVLPQIRKTGGYIPTRNAKTGEQLSDNEVLMVAEQIMQRTISQKNLPADSCLTTSEIAKSLGMPTKEVNRVLVSEGILFWNGGRYKIRKEYADCNYVRERRFHYFALDGEKKERSYLVWTKKGRDFVNAVVEFKNLSTTWKQKS